MPLSSAYGEEIAARIFHRDQVSVPVGADSAVVLDLRGMGGFAVFLNGGTATWQPCNESGTVVPGSSTTAVVSGTRVTSPWTHVKIVATTAACIAAAI